MKKLLALNRGEIAIRIFRAANELRIRTVAVYSKEDRLSLHRFKADEAYLIGEGKGPVQAYLDVDSIVALAAEKGVDAIHPGYGFLAENARFAEICTKHGIKFIGPTPEMITAMGDKVTAKQTMINAGVPVVPGVEGLLESVYQAKKEGVRIGFPIILKATAGGGGKGMRVVWKEEDIEKAYESAKIEAAASFKNDGIYMEKYV